MAKSRLGELNSLSEQVPAIQLMIDHCSHIDLVESFNREHGRTKPWPAFIKVDVGNNRAGLAEDSAQLASVINRVCESSSMTLLGFYCHAGGSYSSTSSTEASAYLLHEITAANNAAKLAKSLIPGLQDLTLSVGATPSAHATAATLESHEIPSELHGIIELHAGNYPFCDMQQIATGMVGEEGRRVLSLGGSYFLLPRETPQRLRPQSVSIAW